MDLDESRRRLLTWAGVLAIGCAPRVAAPPAVTQAGAPRKPSVLVIGAGLTGLFAAYELAERGVDVRVLEATSRAGGRILTIRAPFGEGLFVEAGAMHVVGDPELLKLFSAMGVALEKRPQTRGLARIVLADGKRTVVPPDSRPPPRYTLSAEEEALGERGRMERYFAAAKTFDPTGPLPAELLGLDTLNGAEFLRRQGASPGFMASIDDMLGLGDAGLVGMSALSLVQIWAEILREIELRGGGFVVGGADKLPNALALRLGARVLYGAAVTRVEQSTRGVRVTFRRGGKDDTLAADRVLFTIPAPVLRSIPISPALSPEKVRALRELELESVSRVWVETDQRFWSARGESGRADTDAALGPVRDETDGMPGTSGVLGVYTRRAEARRLAAMSEEARVQTVLMLMERAHPGTKQHFVVSASKCWDTDPFQLGGYAYFKPGQLTTLGPHLAMAEGRLHFAGDHTSHRPGFMHGALASARRAVTELTPQGT